MIRWVEAVEIATGMNKRFNRDACAFGYRESVFKQHLRDRYFISSITLSLTKKDHRFNVSYGAIREVLEEIRSRGRKDAGAADRLVKAVGAPGAATLLAAAAAGLGAAGVLLTRVLGPEATQVAVRRLQDDLAARVRAQARSGVDPARAVLAAPDLADDAASRLRLRLAVLKGLT